jgi:sugar lactone lactonase YvrE
MALSQKVAASLAAVGLAVASAGSITNTYMVDAGGQLYPEGIYYDQASKHVFLSSMTRRLFAKFDASNNMAFVESYPFDDTDEYNLVALGIKADPSNSSIMWAAMANPWVGAQGRLAAYKLREAAGTDAAKAELLVQVAHTASNTTTEANLMNDLVITGAGDVYYTDSFDSKVRKLLQPDAAQNSTGTNSVIASGDKLTTPQFKQFGPNGVVYDESDDVLVVSNFQTQKLLSVNPDTGVQTEVVLTPALDSGADGMIMLADGRIAAVAHPYVKVLSKTSANWATADVQDSVLVNQTEGEVAATITVADHNLSAYVTFVRFNDIFGGTPNANASRIVRVEFDAAPTTARLPHRRLPNRRSRPHTAWLPAL